MGMTVGEAILTLNANVVIACERAGFDSATVKMIEDALDTIENALKAQEPVKPLKMEVDHVRKEPVVFSYECPVCMCGLQRHWVACPICGRTVKWE